MTTASVALAEERPGAPEAVPVVELAKPDQFEPTARRGLSPKFALATVALVEAGWLAALGYFAVTILH